MRKRNWRKYNHNLVKRGSLTFFIDPASLKKPIRKKTFGRPRLYTHPLLHMLLVLKIQYRLSYRSLEGFAKEVLPRFLEDILIPNYTVICRRAAELKSSLPKLSSRRPQVVLIDATGIKVHGEGEWKVKVHGKSKRRKWIKVHIGIDEKTQEIMEVRVTDSRVADCEVGPEIVDACPRSTRIYKGDGGYDTARMRSHIKKRGGKGLIPPRSNGKNSGKKTERDKAVCEMRGLGLDEIGKQLWGKLTGYSRGALVEASFSRLKRMYGGSFFSRSLEKQRVEGHLKCYMLNKMIQKGI